jgi:hypothetical protein
MTVLKGLWECDEDAPTVLCRSSQAVSEGVSEGKVFTSQEAIRIAKSTTKLLDVYGFLWCFVGIGC